MRVEAATMRWLLATLLLLIFVSGVIAQQSTWTGNLYRQMNDVQKVAYSLGLFDGVTIASATARAYGASGPESLYDSCFRARTRGQMVAMIDKFLNDHPDRWHEGMTALVIGMLRETCLKTP